MASIGTGTDLDAIQRIDDHYSVFPDATIHRRSQHSPKILLTQCVWWQEDSRKVPENLRGREEQQRKWITEKE